MVGDPEDPQVKGVDPPLRLMKLTVGRPRRQLTHPHVRVDDRKKPASQRKDGVLSYGLKVRRDLRLVLLTSPVRLEPILKVQAVDSVGLAVRIPGDIHTIEDEAVDTETRINTLLKHVLRSADLEHSALNVLEDVLSGHQIARNKRSDRALANQLKQRDEPGRESRAASDKVEIAGELNVLVPPPSPRGLVDAADNRGLGSRSRLLEHRAETIRLRAASPAENGKSHRAEVSDHRFPLVVLSQLEERARVPLVLPLIDLIDAGRNSEVTVVVVALRDLRVGSIGEQVSPPHPLSARTRTEVNRHLNVIVTVDDLRALLEALEQVDLLQLLSHELLLAILKSPNEIKVLAVLLARAISIRGDEGAADDRGENDLVHVCFRFRDDQEDLPRLSG